MQSTARLLLQINYLPEGIPVDYVFLTKASRYEQMADRVAHNIQTRLLFSGNLIKHPCFDQLRGTDAYRIVDTLDVTEFIMNNTFWVGVYPGMTDQMIDYMAEVIIEAVSK